MSSAPTDDSIEQTKRQIRSLVNEIADLSKADSPPHEYYPAVLQRIVTALAAPGGAVWLMNEGSLSRAYQVQSQPEMLLAESGDAVRHQRLITQVLQQGKPELIPPNSTFGESQEMANPTSYLLVLGPMAAGGRSVGMIEIYQRPDGQLEAQRGYLRFIEHVLKLIGDWLKGHAFQEASSRQLLWQQADEFARLAHNSLDLRDTAYTIANEGRRLIECDRVSVATIKGRNAKVIAMSGQDTVESRSNEVQSLNNLATRVVRSGEALWYDGSTVELPPQIEEAVEEYVDLSHGRTVAVLPVYEPERTVAGDVLADRDKFDQRKNSRRIIGAIIVEQIETQLSRQELEGRVDLVYEHACRAIANSQSHSNLFLMPLWKTLDRLTWLFRGSAFPKTMLVLALLAAAIAALTFIKIDFDLEAKGNFKPSVEQNVFAHVDGTVEDVYVKTGDIVEVGRPLVRLSNPDLENQLASLIGDLNTAVEQYVGLSRNVNVEKMTAAEGAKLKSDMAENLQQQRSLEAQIAILEKRREQLLRTSPIAGVVTTWDVEKTLRVRPVVTGQVLVNVAALDRDWYLEVLMPEKHMKHIDRAFSETEEQFLPCEYILKSDPGNVHLGKLYKQNVNQRAELNADQGTAVRLKIIPDSMEGISPLNNSEVTVDVKCGRAAAGYAWFHEIPEWIRANVIF